MNILAKKMIPKIVKEHLIELLLVLFGILIAYQLVRKLIGGSWQTESLIIALLIFDLGLTWRIGSKLEGHLGWHRGQEAKGK